MYHSQLICALCALCGFTFLSTALAEESRTWTSTDGRTIEATLQSTSDDSVTIRRDDGRTFTIPLATLSEADRDYVSSLENEAARRNGLNEGPYAEAATGEWVKFPKEKHGLIYQFFAGKKLRREKEALFPLVIYLHGAGNSGADVTPGEVGPIAKKLTVEDQYDETPAFVCVPLCPSSEGGWGKHVAELNAIIDDLIATLPIDRERIYLTGFSMGARGIGALLKDRPTFYAAAAFADGEVKPEWAETMTAAMWFHFSGERDIAQAEATAKAFTAAGKTARFEGHPNMIHNAMGSHLANHPELFPWMFEKRRPAESSE